MKKVLLGLVLLFSLFTGKSAQAQSNPPSGYVLFTGYPTSIVADTTISGYHFTNAVVFQIKDNWGTTTNYVKSFLNTRQGNAMRNFVFYSMSAYSSNQSVITVESMWSSAGGQDGWIPFYPCAWGC